jgi:hypothetical protein
MVEDPMDYLLAALFGLSIGTLMAYSRFPPTRWLPSVAATVVLVTGASAPRGNGLLVSGVGRVTAHIHAP